MDKTPKGEISSAEQWRNKKYSMVKRITNKWASVTGQKSQ